ncbi:hypothetical protein OG884_20470 [Streptosporangium sp. NBC_01755]|nr:MULTISPECIES: hypothetical protein [unclassified Streptosporangium]WSA24649.1 hypothetical protein OIE13_27445 [Streptosporangium sp. NBC_01810]WSC97275.1 hypothetical protein OG884_20470 [Streptosporangium sp. NBC_01755]
MKIIERVTLAAGASAVTAGTHPVVTACPRDMNPSSTLAFMA